MSFWSLNKPTFPALIQIKGQTPRITFGNCSSSFLYWLQALLVGQNTVKAPKLWHQAKRNVHLNNLMQILGRLVSQHTEVFVTLCNAQVRLTECRDTWPQHQVQCVRRCQTKLHCCSAIVADNADNQLVLNYRNTSWLLWSESVRGNSNHKCTDSVDPDKNMKINS